MVFLLSTEDKKWSLHYQYTQIRGKMWGKVLICVTPNIRRGDYPHCNESPDIMTKSNFWS